MPRAPRLHASGLFFHVFARGNNRESIFYEDINYVRFLDNLERYRESLKFNLLVYCLMPNHFHLLMQVGNVELAKIMQVLMTAYTMYINKMYKRVGHLFQGRYQSIAVEKDTYLLQVMRYIHLNPVTAGLVKTPGSYVWSSYSDYKNQTNQKPLLDKLTILNLFSEIQDRQISLFEEFTYAGIKSSFDPFLIQKRGILGSTKYYQKLTKVLKGMRP